MRTAHRLLLFLLLSIPAVSFGQISEMGVSFGATGYKGELNEHMLTPNLDVYHSAFGLFFRRNTNAHWAYRFNFLKGKVSGSDANSSSQFAKVRNLSFTSPIVELAFLLEFNFFPFEKYGTPYWATPYVFAGYSGFYSNPTSTVNGQKFQLRTLQLEGKGYSSLARSIPMGVGVKFKAGGWIFAAEFGARKTTTDYVDDVSGSYLGSNTFKGPSQSLSNPSPDTTFVNLAGRQRGNKNDKDWFMFLGVTVSHHIGNIRKHECERLMKNM